MGSLGRWQYWPKLKEQRLQGISSFRLDVRFARESGEGVSFRFDVRAEFVRRSARAGLDAALQPALAEFRLVRGLFDFRGQAREYRARRTRRGDIAVPGDVVESGETLL